MLPCVRFGSGSSADRTTRDAPERTFRVVARCGAWFRRCDCIDREPHDWRRSRLGVETGDLDRRCSGLVAGSMSMAVGEYVSVSAQRDSEQADVALERQELADEPRAELKELAMIYVNRGLEKDLAMKVAQQLSDHDRLGSHMRDELGIEKGSRARPLQAAWISATSFASFATVPIAALLIA